MKVFALSDLHLPGGMNKPMDVFGPAWDEHPSRIEEAWRKTVGEGDLVLISGDISWAMQLDGAAEDLNFIASLPGKKLILRGNHDYWWNSISKVRARLPEGVFALQNDAFTLDGVCVCGSRGWAAPGSSAFSEGEDRAIYERELLRLEMSLQKAGEGKLIIGMLHYPPFTERHQPTGFSELFERYKAQYVVYGHLHDKSCANAFDGEHNGTRYALCSADHLRFDPRLITEM